jgi:hypothetical protein
MIAQGGATLGRDEVSVNAAVSSGTYEPVVFGMCADPNPRDRIRSEHAKSAMVVSDADAEAIRVALQPAEVERRMMRVASPQVIILDG